ncbi:DNA mismatch repair protein MutL [Bacteroidia bacterium]|nr:DNA mismatch repair protein MutL [Bacteroidia bacterium]GHV07513.1 DNA mismatch repair protein MutL [Bacteroidia bacterium]
MSDVIHLLSDSIANQIAAGEVIQRPASVVKELMENSVDAGAGQIQLLVKDAGRTLIQVIDNGKGMSETDARMAFERHATSKIQSANDLFSLQTMGFRGEALASIAAVAQVELKTARKEDETGTLIRIAASQLEKQEPAATNCGSIFSVKNIFFNVPARRKFLKSNETEFKNILTEFERVALVNPQISFELSHNDSEIFNLPVSGLRQRIVNVFGKKLNTQLLSLQVETSLITVSGFVGTPESCKKKGNLQYFFVNNRYMRHPYFHKAVAHAFEPFIPAGESPNYFIYLTIDPGSIDVNIHPTKTEIKFENEQAIWLILSSAVKEAIGKSNAIPSLEFDRDGEVDMPVYNKKNSSFEAPKTILHAGYNPFKDMDYRSKNATGWEKLYEEKQQNTDFSPNEQQAATTEIFNEYRKNILFYKGKYLITPLKSGLTLIDGRRAHIRVLFDEYMQRINQRQGVSQGLLFPEIISFTPREATILPYLLDDLAFIGFDLADLGNNSYSINGIPSGLENTDPIEMLQELTDKVLDTGCEVKEEISETIALTLAKQAAIPYGKSLSEDEADSLIAKLFASSGPNYTPDGKCIVYLISDEELEKKFR